MQIFNESITVFNRRTDRLTNSVSYFKRIIDNVAFVSTKAVSSASDGIIGADKFKVYIPYFAKTRENLSYISPEDFDLSPLSGYTFNIGDIIVRGVCDKDIPPYSESDVLNLSDAFEIFSITEYPFGRKTRHRMICGGDWRGR